MFYELFIPLHGCQPIECLNNLGISFTADNCALVYLVDDGGARTTSDMFHDLYEANISDTLFR